MASAWCMPQPMGSLATGPQVGRGVFWRDVRVKERRPRISWFRPWIQNSEEGGLTLRNAIDARIVYDAHVVHHFGSF